MRLIAVLFVSLCLFSVSFAEESDEKITDCYDKAIRKIPVNDTVNVLLIDGTVLKGIKPNVMSSSSFLYIRDTNNMDRRMIPINDIESITYTKPNRVLGFTGVIIGMIGGTYAGISMAPEPEGFLGFPEFGCGLAGLVIGGVVGGLIGSAIGEQLKITVNLNCR